MKKLTIFVPTYQRPEGLDALLASIFVGNGEYAAGIEVVLSSNAPWDEASRDVAERWQRRHGNIRYFCNEENIGIDRNHDLVYRYCNTPYALFLADDDFLAEGSLGEIIHSCTGDFTFGIMNALPAPPRENIRTIIQHKLRGWLGRIRPVYRIADGIIQGEECRRLFADKSAAPGILPLLPYYSGILVDVGRVRSSPAFAGRDAFQGTLHQYIGTLWNAVFSAQGNVRLLAEPMLYLSFRADKTWTDAMDALVRVGLPRFYQALDLPSDLRDALLADMQQRTSGWKMN